MVGDGQLGQTLTRRKTPDFRCARRGQSGIGVSDGPASQKEAQLVCPLQQGGGFLSGLCVEELECRAVCLNQLPSNSPSLSVVGGEYVWVEMPFEDTCELPGQIVSIPGMSTLLRGIFRISVAYWILVFIPMPVTGECVCTASPTRKTRFDLLNAVLSFCVAVNADHLILINTCIGLVCLSVNLPDPTPDIKLISWSNNTH